MRGVLTHSEAGVAVALANVIDDFDNRTLPDTSPAFIGGGSGDWGFASSGGEYPPGPVGYGASEWFCGVSDGVGRAIRDSIRGGGYPSSGEAEEIELALGAGPSPTNDEPIFSIRFRTGLIPDGAHGAMSGVRDRTEIYIEVASTDGEASMDLQMFISSVAGRGLWTLTGISGGVREIAKTDWVANAWYTAKVQNLHTGSQRAKIWKDGDPEPWWQLTGPYGDPGGRDYVTWSGGIFFFVELIVNDDYDDDLTGFGLGADTLLFEFDDIIFGTIGGGGTQSDSLTLRGRMG